MTCTAWHGMGQHCTVQRGGQQAQNGTQQAGPGRRSTIHSRHSARPSRHSRRSTHPMGQVHAKVLLQVLELRCQGEGPQLLLLCIINLGLLHHNRRQRYK